MPLNRKNREWLTARFKDRVRLEEPMSRHTFFRIGGPADAYVMTENRDQLLELIDWADVENIPFMIIGNGSNLLVMDNGIRGLVIKLTRQLREIVIEDRTAEGDCLKAMAGAGLHRLCTEAVENGLEGLNFAFGIPGSVGGAIIMNAGTHGSCIADVLESITVIQPVLNGRRMEIQKINRNRLNFSYRKLTWQDESGNDPKTAPIILEGRFRLKSSDPEKIKIQAEEIMQQRKRRQPTDLPGAGCFFKNPDSGESAGRLIEQAGLKGKKIGGAEISTKHANFIVNTGNASADDVLALAKLAQETVRNNFNILLELEVKIAGS